MITLFEPKVFQLPTRCKMRLEWLDLLQAVGVLLMNIAWNPTIGSCSTQTDANLTQKIECNWVPLEGIENWKRLTSDQQRLNAIGFSWKKLGVDSSTSMVESHK